MPELPAAFHTFSAFRRSFTDVSAYCYCADSLGRELQATGLELLLDEIYDTIFNDSQLGHSFTDTGIYRILQRRFLAVRLLITGRFRCPTKCEIERFTASSFGNVFIPSCDDNGNYLPVQCQNRDQCWCVDSNGQEIFGTRQQRREPDCSNGESDCKLERKSTLSRLFYGPVGHFSRNDIFATPTSLSTTLEKIGVSLSHCSADLKQLFTKSGLLLSIPQSVDLDIGQFDLEMILGTSEFSKDTFNLNQTIEDNFGRSVNLQENQNIVKLITFLFEHRNVLTTLLEVINFFGGEDDNLAETVQLVLRSAKAGICDCLTSHLFLPKCTGDGRSDGNFKSMQCDGMDCICVDLQGRKTPELRKLAGGGVQ
eukprot:g44865.t1